jgi:hypothetical protein
MTDGVGTIRTDNVTNRNLPWRSRSKGALVKSWYGPVVSLFLHHELYLATLLRAAKASTHHDLDSRLGARQRTGQAACPGATSCFLVGLVREVARRLPRLAQRTKGYSIKSA